MAGKLAESWALTRDATFTDRCAAAVLQVAVEKQRSTLWPQRGDDPDAYFWAQVESTFIGQMITDHVTYGYRLAHLVAIQPSITSDSSDEVILQAVRDQWAAVALMDWKTPTPPPTP